MTPLFLDTGYLLALELSNDQNHRPALRHWRSLTRSLPPLVTTTYIFDEVVTFFNSRGHHAKAVEVGGNLVASRSVTLVHVDEDLFLEGWRYFQRHEDKSFSLTDCISFVVMERRALDTALTFDKHFAQAGFKRLP